MKSDNKILLVVCVLVIAILMGAMFVLPQSSVRSDLEPFAKCLSDNGVKFYGAYWCPHCQNQKKLFGTAKNLVPYIECSTPDGKSQIQQCADAGIESYPTWVFSDGSKFTGELSLEELSSRSKCVLP